MRLIEFRSHGKLQNGTEFHLRHLFVLAVFPRTANEQNRNKSVALQHILPIV